jgi:serine/threonine protein kinase
LIEQRIRKLTVLLAASAKPALFRGPDCVGFCRDLDRRNPRYGLIFERPADHPPTDRLVSLLTLLKEKHKISLTARIRLAHSIARSLMYLHSVNWLHKGLRSDNIIFFVSGDREPDMDTQIVAGFEYARPDLSDEETDKPRGRFEHNIYRHPEVLGAHNPRSRKSHDIYSLGVILIEIALWQPVQDAVTETGKQFSSQMRISKFRQALLDPQFLINVEMHAGEKYRRVVERCLLGGLAIGVPPGTDESSPAVGAAMLTAFVEEVVVPLKSIHI